MPVYQARSGVEVEAELATGRRTAQTPQGVVVAQAGDAIVRLGNEEAVIAGQLWARWFEPKPRFSAIDLQAMTKAELVGLGQEHGLMLSTADTKASLIAEIERATGS